MKNVKLQTARETSGKTQAQVARAAKVTEQMYQRYEYGQSEPCVRTAIRIADALNVLDLRELFAATPDATTEGPHNPQDDCNTAERSNQPKSNENGN